VRQFLRAWRPPLGTDERAEALAWLRPAEAQLFNRLAHMDQRHSFDVYRSLRHAGESDGRVLRAALLHDVGKVEARLSSVERSALVLLQTLTRGRSARRVPQGGPLGRYGRYLHHAERGHQLLLAAGSEAEVAELAASHERAKSGPAARLRRADDLH
jgi:hypothetical protein